MAESFLSSLPVSVRQAFPIIQRGIREGLAANSILKSLRDAGMGIRRQTLLDVARLVREGFRQQGTLRLLGAAVVPPSRFIPKALHAIRRSFSYVVELQTVFQGALVTRRVTISTDEALSRQRAEEEASRAVEEREFDYGEGVEVISSSLVSILRAP